MATNRVSPKKGKVVDIPTVPTVGTATAGPVSATVAFTAATVGGPVTTFTALSNPGSVTGTGTSPITVSGLTAGTAYTFTVRGDNATGSSGYSSASNSITALVSPSYESIATVTLGTAASSIALTSIPSTYKHLQIRYMAQSTRATYSADNIQMRINSNTSTNYSRHTVSGYGAGTAADGTANSSNYIWQGQLSSTVTANIFGVGIIDILDYADTNKNKTARSLAGVDLNGVNNTVNGATGLYSGAWYVTDAIVSIQFFVQSGPNFAAGSTIALYGIKG
jgi:hypothetical protein